LPKKPESKRHSLWQKAFHRKGCEWFAKNAKKPAPTCAPLGIIFLGLLETRKVGGIKAMAQVKITVRPNGPYRVEAPEGSVELVDVNGTQYDLTGKPAFSLCRCGGSVNKPFCDGTHSRIGFQGAELAVKKADG
jgi:CDGSH-type Zn-finger protein